MHDQILYLADDVCFYLLRAYGPNMLRKWEALQPFLPSSELDNQLRIYDQAILDRVNKNPPDPG